MSETEELFDHNEWLEQMKYFYSKVEEAGSVYEAHKLLPGVPIDDIHEAVETLRPRPKKVEE